MRDSNVTADREGFQYSGIEFMGREADKDTITRQTLIAV